MFPVEFLFLGFILFIITFASARLAISPLLDAAERDKKNIDESGLANLKNIGVLNDKELNEVVEFFHIKAFASKEYETYLKYSKVLKELRDADYFTEEIFHEKMNKLKKFYGVE